MLGRTPWRTPLLTLLVDEVLLVGANRQMNPGSRYRTNRPFTTLDANKDEDGYANHSRCFKRARSGSVLRQTRPVPRPRSRIWPSQAHQQNSGLLRKPPIEQSRLGERLSPSLIKLPPLTNPGRPKVQAADEVSINGLIAQSTNSLSINRSFVGWAKRDHPIS